MTSPLSATTDPEDYLRAYAKVQQVTDRQILAMLQQSSKDVNRQIAAVVRKPGIGAVVRAEQLNTIKRTLLREQASIFRRLGMIVRARRIEAASRAVDVGSKVDAVLFRAARDAGLDLGGLSAKRVADNLKIGMTQTVEVAVTRMEQSAYPLAQRVYRTQVWLDGRIQTKVNSALARGLSAREFAAEARDWISPSTPGGVRYAVLRLARTEINNAYHAMSVNAAAGRPWVTGMRWNLSGSHPRPDECNRLADIGTFDVEDVPRKPHPHCLCVVTPEVDDVDTFLDKLVAGKYEGVRVR